MVVPYGRTLPKIGILDERLEAVGAERGLEDEDRLRCGEEDLVPLETESLGIEGRPRLEQRPHRVVRLRPYRQHDRDPAVAFRAELQRGEALGDLGEHP